MGDIATMRMKTLCFWDKHSISVTSEALVRIAPSDLAECFHYRQNDRHRTL